MKVVALLSLLLLLLFSSNVFAQPENESARQSQSDAAYDKLTDREQKRVDAIRAEIKGGLMMKRNNTDVDGLSKRDLDWAWNGAGREVLHDDLLAAAKTGNNLPKDFASLFKLEPDEIVLWSLESFSKLMALVARANELQDDTTNMGDNVLAKLRDDPLLKPFVEDRIKRFRDPAYAALVKQQSFGKQIEKWKVSLSNSQTELAEQQTKLPEFKKQAVNDRSILDRLKLRSKSTSPADRTPKNQTLNNSLQAAEAQSARSSQALEKCESEIDQCKSRIYEAQHGLGETPEGRAALDDLRREQKESQQRQEQVQRDQDEAKKHEVVAQALVSSRLRHTFTNNSGNYSIDATIVKVDKPNEMVSLIRMSDKKLITVELSKLSDSDRDWIILNTTFVNAYGKAIADELQGLTGQPVKHTPGLQQAAPTQQKSNGE